MNSPSMSSPPFIFTGNSNLDIYAQAGENSHYSKTFSHNTNFNYNTNNNNNVVFNDRMTEKQGLNNEIENFYTESYYNYFDGSFTGVTTKNIAPSNALESYDTSDGVVKVANDDYNAFHSYDSSSATSDFNSNLCNYNTDATTCSYQSNYDTANHQVYYPYNELQHTYQNQHLHLNNLNPNIRTENYHYNSSHSQTSHSDYYSYQLNQASQAKFSTHSSNYSNCLVQPNLTSDSQLSHWTIEQNN